MATTIWNAIKSFFAAFHRVMSAVFVRFLLQTVIAKMLLFLVYFFVLGLTAIIVRLGRLFSSSSRARGRGWQPATGYEPSLESSMRQS